jgi:hypothetical protein
MQRFAIDETHSGADDSKSNHSLIAQVRQTTGHACPLFSDMSLTQFADDTHIQHIFVRSRERAAGRANI